MKTACALICLCWLVTGWCLHEIFSVRPGSPASGGQVIVRKTQPDDGQGKADRLPNTEAIAVRREFSI